MSVCAFLCLLCCVYASNPDSTHVKIVSDKIAVDIDTVEVLNEITVSASRIRKEASPVQILSGKTLENLTSCTIADAIKYFSGVQIKDYGGLGGQKIVNVRSMGTQHTGVYIDGIRITNCQNGTVDLGKYSLANMESVELYNANKVSPLMTASEYASASTIYLTTKRPDKSGIKATYSNGSFGTNRGQVHGTIGNHFFADAEFLHTKGDYTFSYKSEYEDTTGVRSNSDITFCRFESGYFSDHLTAHIYLYDSNRGLPGGIVRRLSDKYGDVGREKDLNTFAQISYNNSWNGHSLRINGRYAYDWLHANSDYKENMFVHYNNKYTQQDVYTAAAYSYKLNSLTLSVSPDLRLSDLKSDVYGLSYVIRTDFKASASAAYSHNGLNASAALLYTYIQDHSEMPVAGSLSQLTPDVHISYKKERWAARGFYKTVFRAPTLNDLYYTHVGKRDLKPEYTEQYDVGVTYSSPYLDIQLDAYYNKAKDKIICIPQGGSYNWRMMNRGLVKTFGTDISARATYKGLSLFVTATWQDVRDRTDKEDKETYGHKLLYSPTWSFSTILSFDYKKISASISHMYCSERYWSYADPEDVLDAYNCTDAKIQYKVWRVTLSAECQDLFDIRYEIVQRWPMPGRRFQFSITFEI